MQMSKKSKVLKYKVVNTNIDKKFIGKNIDLERVKSKGSPTTKPRANAPAWFKEFSDNINKRLDKQEEFNKSLINRINNLVKVNKLKE